MQTIKLNPKALAIRFSAVLREYLGPDTMTEVITRNATPTYAGDCCASHDFCDANMAMLEAFAELANIEESEVDLNDEEQARAMSQAWAIAKSEAFFVSSALTQIERPVVEETLRRHDDGTFAFVAGGVEIEWPLTSTCGRFSVDPSHYGFEVYETGGGCTAWRRDFKLDDGRAVYMLVTDDDLSHRIPLNADGVALGVYLEESDDFVGWWVNADLSRVGIHREGSL